MLGTALFSLALSLLIGCSPRAPIDTTYGRRDNRTNGGSVNGTAVLGDLFEEAGFDVTTTRFLGRLVNRSDVVVWAPDDFEPPSGPTRAFFQQWLINQSGRTLVYIARDFDGEAAYWKALEDGADVGDALEYRRRNGLARSKHDAVVSVLEDESDATWFQVDRTGAPRQVAELEGPWSHDVDANGSDIRLASRIRVPRESDEYGLRWKTEVLLESGDDVIAARLNRSLWAQSQIIVISNGSWLLNMPLVNQEHRKLAGRLVQACGSPGQLVFVESGAGDPPISELGRRRHHGLEAFTVWPINVVLLHATACGILYCFSVFAIFGRPRRLPSRDSLDFGRHITALGELMTHTRDAEFARQQVVHYQQQLGNAPTHPLAPTAGNPFATKTRPRESPL